MNGNISQCQSLFPSLCLFLSLSASRKHVKGLTSHLGLPSMFYSRLSILRDLWGFFPQVSPVGKTTQVFRNYPCLRSLCRRTGGRVFHTVLSSHQLSRPWSSCAGIKTGPLQFSSGSRQPSPLHTHTVGCEVSLAGLPAPLGIGVRVSQLHLALDLPWNAWARGGRQPTGLRKTSVPLLTLCLSLFSA